MYIVSAEYQCVNDEFCEQTGGYYHLSFEFYSLPKDVSASEFHTGHSGGLMSTLCLGMLTSFINMTT